MMATGKIRIYDLAREKTPKDYDDKLQKKIQAEITRQIIQVAPSYGQQPKTASSSIDLGAVENIMNEVKVEQIIEELSSSSSSKPAAKKLTRVSPVAEEKKEEEPPKKRLKIVRRIAPVKEETEEGTEEAIATEVETSSEPSTNVEAAQASEEENLVSEPEEVVEPEEQTPDHVRDMVDEFKQKKTATNAPTGQQTSYKKLQSVKSIPLRPTQHSGGGSQPYRVAKPTMASQGMGRRKKRSGPDEDRPKKVRTKKIQQEDTGPKELTVTEAMTVRELAHKINVPETSVITYFFMKKIIKTVNDILEKDLIIEYLEDQGYTVHTEEIDEGHTELKSSLKEDESEGSLMQRPPVVTIMGHVDHGKTTLLDSLRKAKAKVVDQESGGITQHITAYRVATEDYDGNERNITFIDTPGHEAFTAMRKRGANVTDIVILIVAADDGVMPQTIESIKHIREFNVPFLVAVNKIDKPGANPDKVLGQLAEHNIIVEQYGGSVVCSYISALERKNLDDLLEKIILVADAELSEKIRSNPNRAAIGTVIEAELSRARGPLATLLVQNGTLHKGDYVAAGAVSGRVKAIFDEAGNPVDEAGPSSPVEILGLSGVPKAGDAIQAYPSAQEAKKAAEEIAHKELEEKRFRGLSAFASGIREGQEKELRVMIKADVQGSAEAIAHEMSKLSTEEVLVKPISIDSGSITTNDVQMAERTGAVIVGFHVGTDAQTAKLAEQLNVRIKTYEVIYKITEELEHAVHGLHQPTTEEVRLGAIEVRQIFTIDKRKIAGCFVSEGKVKRKEIARVFREGVQIYEGRVDYLKRFKDDAKEVAEGYECGLSFEKYNDLQEGDMIECWTVKEVARASF